MWRIKLNNTNSYVQIGIHMFMNVADLWYKGQCTHIICMNLTNFSNVVAIFIS